MFKAIEDRAVVPEKFPELAKLVWNRDPTRPIDPETAFALYERNWRFVDVDRMTGDEADLLRHLVERYGGGHLLVA